MAALGLDVSAESFYALGASLPMGIDANQRYKMATNMQPALLESQLQDAMLGAIIATPAGLNAAQAASQTARRLVALGTDGAADHQLTVAQYPEVADLLQDWLGYTGDDDGLWPWLLGAAALHRATNPRAHVILILGALTGWDTGITSLNGMYAALNSQVTLTNADVLAGLSASDWTTFFGQHPGYLPESTLPGSLIERIAAFLRMLSKFYTVSSASPAPGGPVTAGLPPVLDRTGFDPIAAFVSAVGFSFGAPLPDAAATAAQVLPGDDQAQAWLVGAVTIVNELWTLTGGVIPAASPNAAALQFSLMEGLFARGFTSAQTINSLSLEEFTAALTGTVVYRSEWAAAIWANANGQPRPAGGAGGFRPVNADGDLVGCNPPPELSPLGPVEYLSELLRAGPGSTCTALPDPDPSSSFAALLLNRRGDMTSLHASRANLSTPIPAIDLVNECLEHLADQVASQASPIGGVVHDTAADTLGGHVLGHPGAPGEPEPENAHDPATLFAALPQYASPSVPVAVAGAYTALARDFSAPDLPYDQPVDVCRSYLRALGTSRYETMRRFRDAITEFVLDPADQPPGPGPLNFDATRWRYPVRADIAREYLGVTAAEDQLLLETPIALSGPPGDGYLLLRALYGFPADTVADADGTSHPWADEVVILSEFLARSGLAYCEFLELWKCDFVTFSPVVNPEAGFGDCPPCCPDRVRIAFPGLDVSTGLARLAVFVRLWRRLRHRDGTGYTFAQLADICSVLGLFRASGEINPGFLRQLAAFQILRDGLHLPLDDGRTAPGATGSARTQLLALWDGSPGSPQWRWAVKRLLGRLEDFAVRVHGCARRSADFHKVLADNLDALSLLAGFAPASPGDTWFAVPTHTLRFTEVLAKVVAAPFTVGELVALLTADDHLSDDDPLPVPDIDDAIDHPLEFPDDRAHSLLALRRELLAIETDDEETDKWTWRRIASCLRTEFGYRSPGTVPDPLTSFATHFFPHVLEAQGHTVAPADRRYSTALNPALTSPHMWNSDAGSPFHYDITADQKDGQLWIELPLRDDAVLRTLADLRQLNSAEQRAVQDLYFRPRAALAALGLLIGEFTAAQRHLIEEPDEWHRWAWMVHSFLLVRSRCRAIARHLAEHVDAVCAASGAEDREEDGGEHAEERAWLVLRLLAADENWPANGARWEDDSGAAPALTWAQPLVGRAFHALLGLCGTGLLTEFSSAGTLRWRDISGPLGGFGDARDHWNAPVPTVLPALDLLPSAEQEPRGIVRNGIGFANDDGRLIGGGEGFAVRWSGALLIERGGTYHFRAVNCDDEDRAAAGHVSDVRAEWRFDLRRGRRSWTVLSRGGRAGHESARTGELALQPGIYDVDARFIQPAPGFQNPEFAGRPRTGFAIKYKGPDTADHLIVIPHDRLFRTAKDGPLGPWRSVGDGKLAADAVPAADDYLRSIYTSTLRDIRRTYQRALKGTWLARNYGLSAVPARQQRQSELGYFLHHPDRFAGTAYYRRAAAPADFQQHCAVLDLDFLPVSDPYRPPTVAQDDRVQPSPQRRQAMADWWERLFDYVQLRRENYEAARPPLWQLFQDASELNPGDAVPLTPHMDIDVDHLGLVTTFLGRNQVTAGDLADERWAQRVWQAEVWAQRVQRHSGRADVGDAHPFLWASDDPSAEPAGPPAPIGVTGVADLTTFVQAACIERGLPRRYHDLQELNDELRQQARSALLGFLCRMDRVPLPASWATPFARRPEDLSDLLLLDVEAGLCDRATRIENAVSAVQALVQRIRLGLEPPLTATGEFIQMWAATFASFRIWQECRRRLIYRENWIEWDELEKARHGEAYRFLETILRERGLSAAAPAGLQYWTRSVPPPAPGFAALQGLNPSELTAPADTAAAPADAAIPAEGFGLLGIPDDGGTPSWLATVPLTAPVGPGTGPSDGAPPKDGASPEDGAGGPPLVDVRSLSGVPGSGTGTALPLLIEAAIRLGVRFLRVAAAGNPAGSALLVPHDAASDPSGQSSRSAGECLTRGCCAECGRVHPPVIDEYYFWLADSAHFDLPDQQVAELAPSDPRIDTAWDDPAHAPALLDWEAAPAVTLHWCRVHNGKFGQPRRCSDSLTVTGIPTLELLGRVGDSLAFRIDGAQVPQSWCGVPSDTYAWNPPYPLWPADAGFRYDLAADDAVVLPLVEAPASAAPFAGLPAYPFFVYGSAGAPLIPISAFAPAMTVAGALRAHCQFESALRWYGLVFEPEQGDNTWSQCPRSAPPPESPPVRKPRSRKGKTTQARASAAAFQDAPASARADQTGTGDEPCCQNSCPSPAVARHRAVTLSVLDTLLELAESVMAENSPEGFARARVALAAAGRILGPVPQIVTGRPPAPPEQTLGQFTPLEAPLNPRLLTLYERVADRLALLRGCETGHRLQLGQGGDRGGYWADDPARDNWRTVRDDCDCDDAWCHPHSPYRFTFLIQKALELAGEVRMLGNELLSALEKGDAEYLASLRSTHERELLQLALSIRKDQWRDADWQVQALRMSKQSAQQQVIYYTGLLVPPPLGLIDGETTYRSLTEAALGTQIASQVLEIIGQVGALMPDVFVDGVASGSTIPGTGRKFTDIFHTLATATGYLAQDLATDAGLNLTEAGWERRRAEWAHQVDIFNIQIKQIQRQILGAERRASQALKDLDSQQRQIEHAAEVDDFLRDKFSSDALYLWLQRHTVGLYRQMYDLAVQVAQQAQRAFNAERGHRTEHFVSAESWGRLHDGLLAGERLELALRRMEKAYLDENRREFELTKHISLRLHFPAAYLLLRDRGECEIGVPEWMFDLDYPGMYMRRIKNVSMSIPCVTGPYAGVHCRLTLLSSDTRIDPRLTRPVHHCCSDRDHGSDYELCPDDPRAVRQHGAVEGIATSSGQADSGLFEVSFRDERYLPFEYAGAVSRWRIELPAENNQFDLETLSDVILHLNFTAREGGEQLRHAANQSAQRHLPGDGIRFFDVAHDFPDAWAMLHGEVTGERAHRQLPLRMSRNMFPFLPEGRAVHIHRIDLFLEMPEADRADSTFTEFLVGHRPGRRGDEPCDGERLRIECIASRDWPRLFHGTLTAPLAPLGDGRYQDVGTFRFAHSAGEVTRMFLFCSYTAAPGALAETHGHPGFPAISRTHRTPFPEPGHAGLE